MFILRRDRPQRGEHQPPATDHDRNKEQATRPSILTPRSSPHPFCLSDPPCRETQNPPTFAHLAEPRARACVESRVALPAQNQSILHQKPEPPPEARKMQYPPSRHRRRTSAQAPRRATDSLRSTAYSLSAIAHSRSVRRWTLPVGPLGSSGRKRIASGTL
jgi:hypothetical protein